MKFGEVEFPLVLTPLGWRGLGAGLGASLLGFEQERQTAYPLTGNRPRVDVGELVNREPEAKRVCAQRPQSSLREGGPARVKGERVTSDVTAPQLTVGLPGSGETITA